MTPKDAAKLTQIAAWHFSRGEDSEKVERYLANIVSGVQPDEITEALAAGAHAVGIAGALGRGEHGTAQDMLDLYRDEALSEWRVLYRVRTGTGPDDWAGGAVTLGRDVSPHAILASAEADALAVLGRVSEHDSLPGGGMPDDVSASGNVAGAGRVELVYVAPV